MNKLKINTWNGILSIVNCFLFAASWFFIIGAMNHLMEVVA